MEHLWAYLHLKQLMEKRECVEYKDEITKEALQIALKYAFVTEITSLVVVKPDDEIIEEPWNENDRPTIIGFNRNGKPLIYKYIPILYFLDINTN